MHKRLRPALFLASLFLVSAFGASEVVFAADGSSIDIISPSDSSPPNWTTGNGGTVIWTTSDPKNKIVAYRIIIVDDGDDHGQEYFAGSYVPPAGAGSILNYDLFHRPQCWSAPGAGKPFRLYVSGLNALGREVAGDYKVIMISGSP